jgi:hypothetical protein
MVLGQDRLRWIILDRDCKTMFSTAQVTACGNGVFGVVYWRMVLPLILKERLKIGLSSGPILYVIELHVCCTSPGCRRGTCLPSRSRRYTRVRASS